MKSLTAGFCQISQSSFSAKVKTFNAENIFAMEDGGAYKTAVQSGIGEQVDPSLQKNKRRNSQIIPMIVKQLISMLQQASQNLNMSSQNLQLKKVEVVDVVEPYKLSIFNLNLKIDKEILAISILDSLLHPSIKG
ncbi:hypothetical protein SUGI_0943130 [Cryptomeria japonica]|nr:hypothetical protein SUGI_0943130 [Cryptomeria japonica]